MVRTFKTYFDERDWMRAFSDFRSIPFGLDSPNLPANPNITIITEPTVTLLAKPQFIEPPHLPCEWLGDATDGERLCEYAGRVCYLSYTNPSQRTTGEYLGNILTQGHGSVLEHANYTFLIEGISRSCSHELVRHRAGCAYSQVSQRYVDSRDVGFVVPPALLEDQAALELWADSCRQALQVYEALVVANMDRFASIEDRVHRRKVARESARSVLPNATETKIVMTANLRAWRTVLELRCGEGAEREIRRMALKVLDQLAVEVPSVFHDFEPYVTKDGTYAARVTHHKV